MLQRLGLKGIMSMFSREGVRRTAVTLLVAFAMFWLLASAINASRRNDALLTRITGVEEETERIKGKNARIRAEMEAVDNDPFFLEQLLIRLNLTAANEKILKE